jgi:rubrerythrin
MIHKLSRRDFLFITVLSPFLFSFQKNAPASETHPHIVYPNTISILKQAFNSEMTAHKHYVGYTERAMVEKYPNIAYMFKAFSLSEKIHADNYSRLLDKLGNKTIFVPFLIKVDDTKSNLSKAAQKELEKIKISYPRFLKEIETEQNNDAIKNLMYSWKSHCQHEKKIKKIHKYTSYFFGSVVKEIEGMNLDIHVCEICGSTIDEVPVLPCEICNKALSHYQKIDRPT